MSEKIKSSAKAEKTLRILEIYHLFITCREVAVLEFFQRVRWTIDKESNEVVFWNKKTISRDIATLKFAGVPIKYSGKRKAYVLSKNPKDIIVDEDEYSKSIAHLGKKEQQYIRKIRRLTRFMKRLREILDSEPVEVHYKEMFPEVSTRTMQRDFATLYDINYQVKYKRTWYEGIKRWWLIPEDERWWDETPIKHYYLNWDVLPDPYN